VTAPLTQRLRAAVHAGPALAATLNDHLDYFGATVHQAFLALDLADPGAVVLTAAVASDPRVADRLEARGLVGSVVADTTPGLDFGPLLRLDLTPSERPAPGRDPG
jgi:hypothetical protein